MSEELQFYRYEWREWAWYDLDGELVAPAFPSLKIELSRYGLAKETPKGYWIGFGFRPWHGLKWVSKTARKRYAYPSKAEALDNFIKRNERRIEILGWQLICCKEALKLAKNMKSED